MTNKERQAFREENLIGYLMVVLAFFAGIHMFNVWNQINLQEAKTGAAVATVPARTTDDLSRNRGAIHSLGRYGIYNQNDALGRL